MSNKCIIHALHDTETPLLVSKYDESYSSNTIHSYGCCRAGPDLSYQKWQTVEVIDLSSSAVLPMYQFIL
jgi:hypothetical protein